MQFEQTLKKWDRHYQVYQVLPEYCTMKCYRVVLATKTTRQLEQKDPPPKKKENILCPLTWWHFPYILQSEVTKSQLKHIQNFFLLWLFMHISWIQKSKPALAPNKQFIISGSITHIGSMGRRYIYRSMDGWFLYEGTYTSPMGHIGASLHSKCLLFLPKKTSFWEGYI